MARVVAQLIVGKDASSQKGYTYHLFVLPNDPEKAKWDGLPIGTEGAIKSYQADEVPLPYHAFHIPPVPTYS